MSAEIVFLERARKRLRAARKPKRPTKKYPPGYFAPALREIARQWTVLGGAGVAAILEDARKAGRDWP